eukprot:8850489-Lingulodinium_polyedra.AAC.3
MPMLEWAARNAFWSVAKKTLQDLAGLRGVEYRKEAGVFDLVVELARSLLPGISDPDLMEVLELRVRRKVGEDPADLPTEEIADVIDGRDAREFEATPGAEKI